MLVRFLDYPLLFLLGLIALMLGSFWIGRLLAVVTGRADEADDGRHGALDGMIYAIFGLVLGLSFALTADRFGTRARQLVDEVQTVTLAWQTIDVLPADSQPAIRDAFVDYLKVRGAVLDVSTTDPRYDGLIRETRAGQRRLWSLVVPATPRPDAPGAAMEVVLPAFNDMIAVAIERTTQVHLHLHPLFYAFLFAFASGTAMVLGHSMAGTRRPNPFRLAAFCVLVALTLYVHVDLEFPSHGLIRLDGLEEAMRALFPRGELAAYDRP